MPSIERFNKQDKEYQEKILPTGIKRFVIERSSAYSWYQFENNKNHLFTVDSFGYSADKEDIDEKFNITKESIIEKIETEI